MAPTEKERGTGWPHGWPSGPLASSLDDVRLLLYLTLHAFHALGLLFQGFVASRPHAIYRAGLQTIDCGALLFAVAGSRFAQRTVRSPEFKYGSCRVYVLSGFVLALVVMMDAVLRIVHSLEMFIWGPEPNEPQHLLRVSFFEAAIGAVGIAMFAGVRRRRARWPKDDTSEGVFLHAAAECMDGTAIAFAALCTSDLYSRARLAAVYSGVAAVTSANMAWPLLKSTSLTLAHATPEDLSCAVATRLRQVALLEGVVDVYEPHFWPQAPGVHIGTMRVLIRPAVDEQLVLSQVLEVFGDLLDDLTVQIERREESFAVQT